NKHQKIFVHKDLRSCSHVFVRIDRIRKALEPPYQGPYRVVERSENFFTLSMKNVNISIDHLKPAYLLVTDKDDKPTPEEEHKEHLKIVFERLQQYGLRINISKSVMGADRIEYLGFLITAEGSRPLPEKVEAIINYKLPSTIHDLRTFLGLINFYRRYLKDAAKTQAALHELLKGA
ncbi:retrovirus-related Pol polyprotein from transposon opus, partial [Nephila pilipes]